MSEQNIEIVATVNFTLSDGDNVDFHIHKVGDYFLYTQPKYLSADGKLIKVINNTKFGSVAAAIWVEIMASHYNHAVGVKVPGKYCKEIFDHHEFVERLERYKLDFVGGSERPLFTRHNPRRFPPENIAKVDLLT